MGKHRDMLRDRGSAKLIANKVAHPANAGRKVHPIGKMQDFHGVADTKNNPPATDCVKDTDSDSM